MSASRALVAEQGLDALTFSALEERLSFTRGVITHHFASKDEVVRAVFASAIDDIDEGVRTEVEAGDTIEEKIRAILHGNVRGFIDNAEAGRVLLSFWGRLSADPAARKLNADLYDRYRTRCAKLLHKLQKAGEIHPLDRRESTTLGALLVGIVLGIVMQHYFDPGSIDVEAAVDEATRSVLARLVPPATRRSTRRKTASRT